MLNLFGVPVPDEVTAALLAAATKRTEEAKKNFKPKDSVERKELSDWEDRAKQSADKAKQFLNAYLAQGFSRSEAFELTKNNLNTKF